jgi:hypothetical protein
MKPTRILYCKTKKGMELICHISDIFNIPKGDKIDKLIIGEHFPAKSKKRK